MRCMIAIAVLSLGNHGWAKATNSKGDTQTKGVMHTIFNPIKVLLPLSINGSGFSDEKNHDLIQTQVNHLAENATLLREHAKIKNPNFQFLSHGLARDASDVKTWFDLKRYDEARFVLHNVTEYCINCHTKAKSKGPFPGAADFFENVDVKALPDVERAHLLVATRQFEEGLSTFEAFFSSNQYTPAEMALMPVFTDYLKVAIRVQQDFKRPIPVLTNWKQRPGVPPYMVKEIDEWIAALKLIESKGLMGPPALQHGRELVALATGNGRTQLDRSKLVYFIAASALLDQVINDVGVKPAQQSEAFYLLGLCELVIGRSFWVSQTEFFLEASIQAAPGSTTAMRAYQLLNEQIEYEFSGTSGTNIPIEVKTRLEVLKKLAFKK